MSYDQTKMVLIGGGGAQGQQLWLYYTSDNLASNTAGALVAGYFNNAYNDTPGMRAGDIIMAINGSTPVVTVLAIQAIDANGVTVVPSAGAQAQLKS